MVQVWEEKRYNKTLLLNHNWRSRDDVLKKGFKIFYQEVTQEQLLLIKALKNVTSEEDYNIYKEKIGNKLFNKLIKYNYLTKNSTKELNRKVWHSQAGEHLYKYIRLMYGIEYPERPSRVLLLPTLRCNGNCIFCITNSKSHNTYKEMDTKWWEKTTERVCKELQPCSVDIVGGEPLIRFDVSLRIVKVLVKNNILVKVITNGLALENAEKVSHLYEVLKDAKHNIQISLDGTREVHNFIRPGVDYDRVLKAIRNVSQIGLTFGVNLTINKHNIYNIESIIDEISQYKPAYILIGPLQVSPKNVELCKEIMINKTDEENLRKYIINAMEKHPNIVMKYDKEEPVYLKESVGLGSGKKYHTCTGFIEEMSIGPEGNVIPCLRGSAFNEFWGDDITTSKDSLREIWLNSGLSKSFRSIPLAGKCKKCKYNQQCNQGCPLETYVLEGMLGGFDPHCDYKPE